MGLIHSIILGMIQGLGEFLPISSSGHLVVIPQMLRWEDQGLAFDVALHIGTLFAVIYYFRQEIAKLLFSFAEGIFSFSPFSDKDSRFCWYILAATIPGAVAGYLLEKKVETVFRNPAIVATTMILLGIILLLADRKTKVSTMLNEISFGTAMMIGLSQALAVIPGVSRSGITISVALLLNMKRDDAARFSFLLSIPIIAGAGLLEIKELFRTGFSPDILTGMASAAIFGFLSIKYLLAYVRTKNYLPFVWYRFLFGAIVLGWIFLSR